MGLVFDSASGRDGSYYRKKREAEKAHRGGFL